MRRSILALAMFAGVSLSPAFAFDQRLVGAWSQSTSDCAAMFHPQRRPFRSAAADRRIPDGLIITPSSIVSPTAKCSIRKATAQKDMVTLAMTCSNSIGFYDRQAQIKVENNVLTYGFPWESTPRRALREMSDVKNGTGVQSLRPSLLDYRSEICIPLRSIENSRPILRPLSRSMTPREFERLMTRAPPAIAAPAPAAV